MVTKPTSVAPDDPRPDLQSEDASAAFTHLFDTHARSIHRYLARRVGTGAADDLLGDTFVAAWASRSTYDPRIAEARVWLFGIATNVCRKHQRDEIKQLRLTARLAGRRRETTEPTSDVVDRVDAEARLGRLAEALIRLSAPDRDVLLLTAWAHLTATEVGVALGIPAGTARSRLHRARAALRAAEMELT